MEQKLFQYTKTAPEAGAMCESSRKMVSKEMGPYQHVARDIRGLEVEHVIRVNHHDPYDHSELIGFIKRYLEEHRE